MLTDMVIGVRALLVLVVLFALTGCVGDRERPGGITDPDGLAALTAHVVAPETGSLAIVGETISITIEARDLSLLYLSGVGYVARRIGAGGGTVDSVGIFFPLRSDTTHAFTLEIPDMPTNTQLDIYGIAYGHGGVARLSEPVHLTVARLSAGGGVRMARRLH